MLFSKLGYLNIQEQIRGNKEAPTCRGGCVSESIKLLGALSSKFLVSVRQSKKEKEATLQYTFLFFPFLLTLNTSVNQQSHSVTTIVMLEE